jgi:hypothetical protein
MRIDFAAKKNQELLMPSASDWGDLKEGAITYVKAQRPLIPLIEPDGSHLTSSAPAQFLKRGGKVREIPPQSRYSRFAKLRDSNGLQFQSHLSRRRV